MAIADLVPGEETDIWVELEHSNHKKHIRNHSEFHEDLNARKKNSADLDPQQQQQQHSTNNLEPASEMPVESSPFVSTSVPEQEGYLNGGRHQDFHRDGFRPLHARQSRYAADSALLQSPAETPVEGKHKVAVSPAHFHWQFTSSVLVPAPS